MLTPPSPPGNQILLQFLFTYGSVYKMMGLWRGSMSLPFGCSFEVGQLESKSHQCHGMTSRGLKCRAESTPPPFALSVPLCLG